MLEAAPGQFQVRVRYGRRGEPLTTTLRSAAAVTRAAADRLFDGILAERRRSGFVVDRPAGTPADRDAHIVALLEQGSAGWTDLDHVLFRAGELRIRAAAAPIARMTPGTDRQAWNIARALLRCGDPATASVAAALAADPQRPTWVTSLARHAAQVLGSPLPEPVEWPDAARNATPDALDAVYRSTFADPSARASFLSLLAEIPLIDAPFAAIRRIYKAAEARADGDVWGLLVRRFDRAREIGGGKRPLRRGVNPATGRVVFTPGNRVATGRYLRRRSWRTLRRLAEAGLGVEYCRMAAGVILAYGDLDAAPPWPRTDWTLAHVLFGADLHAQPRSLTVSVVGRDASTRRLEAHPYLWDDAPDVLADLLAVSRFAPAHTFARSALLANRARWPDVPLSALVAWFDAPYPATVAFAGEVGLTRFDPDAPDPRLLLGLLRAGPSRAQARDWAFAARDRLLADEWFPLGLLFGDDAGLARDWLSAGPIPHEIARALVAAVVARALGADPPSDAAWRDATRALLGSAAQALADLPLDRVAALVRHPQAGIAELGAQILVIHGVRPPDLPDDLLAAALSSPHAAVRAFGAQLYGELPDGKLAERFRVLVDLLTSDTPEVRAAARPIVARLCAGSAAFARVLVASLIPALIAHADADVVRDGVATLRADVGPRLSVVDTPLVFRLLRAPDPLLQELGGELLRANVDPSTLTPHQLGVLASSDIAVIREVAFGLALHRVEQLRADPAAFLPLVEARWADSRARAFAFVTQHLGEVPTDVVLAICDSVRPDVQAFGCTLLRFTPEDGPRILARLAQHPAAAMQRFACERLGDYAAGDPERIRALEPFFRAVLTRPNVGRVAKQASLAFLERQLVDPACAVVIAPILADLVLTAAVSHRARCVEALTLIRALHPDLEVPLRIVPPEVRGAV